MEYTPTPGAPVDMDFNFSPSIAFDQGSPVAGGQLVFVVLSGILSLISKSLPDFESFRLAASRRDLTGKGEGAGWRNPPLH